MNNFYNKDELLKLGFKSIGENVSLSKNASFYGTENISLGNNVRVDDFCIISGYVTIGDFVHISAYTGMFGGEKGIIVGDYVAVSSRNVIYAISDDYSGEYMTNPTIPNVYRNVEQRQVVIKKHVIIGSGCTILPGVHIGEGAAVGAMSLVNRDLEAWTINKGIPCREYRKRSKRLLILEKDFMKRSRM